VSDAPFNLHLFLSPGDKRGKRGSKPKKQWLPLPYSTFTNSQIPFAYPYAESAESKEKEAIFEEFSDIPDDTAYREKSCLCSDLDEDYDDEEEGDEEDGQKEMIPDEALPVEQRLMYKLLRTYEKAVRPVKNATDTVVVKMGMTLTQIFDMVSDLSFLILIPCAAEVHVCVHHKVKCSIIACTETLRDKVQIARCTRTRQTEPKL
jgi:hypothetical protein